VVEGMILTNQKMTHLSGKGKLSWPESARNLAPKKVSHMMCLLVSTIVANGYNGADPIWITIVTIGVFVEI
jgi:hypothetical protein